VGVLRGLVLSERLRLDAVVAADAARLYAVLTDPALSDVARGLATEAATAVVDECRHAGLRRVWASIRPDNVASRRVVEQLGMHLAATDQDNSGPLHRYTLDL
jgi:L-amino acid N-acyltransferase YncA